MSLLFIFQSAFYFSVSFLFFTLCFLLFSLTFYFSRGRSCFGALLKTDKKRLEKRRKADLYI